MEPILTIDNLNSFGGNMLRQGDKSQLKYRLRDVGNKNLAISSKPCQVRMYGRNYTTVVYETSTTVSSDNTVTFTIDKVLPKGTFYLEFTVGDYIFPTDHKEFFEITPSGKGMESNIIEIVGVDQIVSKVLDKVDADVGQVVEDINTTNVTIQQAEAQRVLAEQERVQGYQEVQQLIENGIELEDDSVDTSNLKTNSVTFNKSSYIEVVGKNILNPENLTLGYTISSNNGNSYVSADYLYTDFIPVSPSTSYHRTISSVVFYDANKNFISGTLRSVGSFTTPDNAAYIRAVMKIEEFPTAQIEIGTVQTYYEPFKVTIKNLEISMDEVDNTIKEAINDYPSIKESVEGLYVSSKNLFNFQDVVNGYMLSAGQLVEKSNYSVSGFIPVEEEINYIANRTITVNFYDRNKVYILGSQKSVVVGDYFTSPVGALYMRIAIPTNAVDTTQVEEGTVTTSFEKYFEPHIPSQQDSELTGKKILFIGDSNTHLNNFPKRIADRTGAVTYNGGAGGTRLTDFSMVNTTNNYHKFNGCAIADAIATGNWTVLETAASEIDVAENQDRIPKYRAQLQNIQDACDDMNNLDAIVLKYGTNDVNNSGFSLGEPDSENRATWNGAINYFIKTIQSVYPHVKIHFCAPVFRELMPQSVENTGSPKNSDEWAKSVMLPDMVEAMRDRTKENHVPFLDLYNESGINQYTATYYLKDKTHYSVAGDVLIAQKVESFLLRG